MLSMDGPNVNWCIHSMLNVTRKAEEHAPLFGIGSCGLHIVHDGFKTGVKSTKWNLDQILKSMFNLSHDSPARREVYILECRNEFPKRFCATRWVEGLPLVERPISVWTNVVKVGRYYEKCCKSKRLKMCLMKHFFSIMETY